MTNPRKPSRTPAPAPSPPISRREVIRGRFLGGLLGAVSDMLPTPPEDDSTPRRVNGGAAPHRGCFPVLRPPGAIAEAAFLETCTRCDACLEACPHEAIVHAPARFRQAAGTPMIDPARQPCRMCDDTPCITACEPRALRGDGPHGMTMGEARIDVHICLAHRSGFCTVCSEQCPVEGAIEVERGKPRIVAERCTGCGVCQHVCPAPANAILLMPRRD